MKSEIYFRLFSTPVETFPAQFIKMASSGFPTELKRLGARMKQIRKARKIKLVQLEAVTRIANGTLSRYENARYPNVELLTLFIIAKALEVTLAELLDYDGPIPPQKK